MLSSRTGLPQRSNDRRWSVRAGLAILGLLASTGCQVEYAGMTLPSGKYMHDDVQYFAPGPEFAYANTQAATQRARMQAQGIPLAPPPGINGPGMGLGGNGPGGMNAGPGAGGVGIPRPVAAPEAENSMPGGASAPNPEVPAPDPATAPGGVIPAPM